MNSLRQARLDKGITLKEMEQSIGINISFLSEIERGLRSPSDLTRIRLNSFFGEQINYLDVPIIKTMPVCPTDWLSAERDFRFLYRAILGLPEAERAIFCSTAIKHLKHLKNRL